MKWSKENKTTTDPTCDEFCQHRYQMCTYINVDPPLYGCQTIGTVLLAPNEGDVNPKWTKETYKTTDPTCAEFCEGRGSG